MDSTFNQAGGDRASANSGTLSHVLHGTTEQMCCRNLHKHTILVEMAFSRYVNASQAAVSFPSGCQVSHHLNGSFTKEQRLQQSKTCSETMVHSFCLSTAALTRRLLSRREQGRSRAWNTGKRAAVIPQKATQEIAASLKLCESIITSYLYSRFSHVAHDRCTSQPIA